jgi:dTDP-3,4-didehydro-2,6-dideoxy-alpha-D-glucose 3-reductase
MMREHPVRFGVLGCASVAWRRLLPALSQCSAARLVAVASRDGQKARRFAERFGAAPVQGYERLLERDDIDAVYVPLPTGLHAEWSTRALRAGKHLLVEKPLAANHREAAAILTQARAAGLRVMENRMFVHHPQHETVRKLVADGEIGELRVLTSAMAIPHLPADDIRYRRDLAGGALLDVGFYPIHAALLFLQQPLDVAGAVLRHDSGVDVGGNALLQTTDGVAAHLTFGFEHSYRSSYELWGSRGRIVVDRAFTPPASWQPVVRIEQQDRTQTFTLQAADQFANAVQCFVNAVREREDDAAHLEASLRGMALIDTIRERAGHLSGTV